MGIVEQIIMDLGGSINQVGHRCVKTKCRGESSSSGRNIGGAQGGDGNVNITRPEGKLA